MRHLIPQRRHSGKPFAPLCHAAKRITVPAGHSAPNGGTAMKVIQSMTALAAIAIGMSPPTLAATSDPEIIIYRFPGVFDDGDAASAGTATVFHCTNFSGATENLR